MTSVLRAAAVVTPERVLRPGWVSVDGAVIVAIGEGEPPAGVPATDLGEAVLVPGFVDVHCHGGGGSSFSEGADAAARAAAAHLAHGTTAVVASLVTGPHDLLLAEVRALEPLVQDGVLAGIHLEGPWLAPSQCGAHDPTQLRPPEPHEVSALVSSDAVVMVTLAPELDGGLDAVRRVVGLGAVAAVGHTDADHATTRAAIDAGARHATHLFNAMRPLHHRDPGPALALLDDPRVTLELVRDGVHLDDALCRWLDSSVDAGRIVAVTDAMAAAGAGDGRYRLGAVDVDVVGGVARVAGGGAVAGSTVTADALFRHVAAPGGDDALLRAARQTAANPAAVLGRDDLGRLAPGARADVVALSAGALEVVGVMREGRWIVPPAPPSREDGA